MTGIFCSRGFWALASVVTIAVSLQRVDAYDALDPYGAVNVKWDIMSWSNGNGYTAMVNLYNTQQYREIGYYKLGWTWGKKEIILAMVGGIATEQGDCSKFPSPPPVSCVPNPFIIDLPAGVPYGQQVANCCRDGVIAAFAQDPANSRSAFQISVGNSGSTNTTVVIPRKLTLTNYGLPGYTCSELVKVPPTKFTTDGKRFTQAYLTWNATCTYSWSLAQKAPSCCVSLSAFYSSDIVKCQDCACSCSPNSTGTGRTPIAGTDQTCISPETNYKDLPVATGATSSLPTIPTPRLYCTNDMCPVKIHWHVKENYVDYWRVKITVTNRNLVRNYSNWNIVVQHPNFVNFTEAFSFTYKPLTPFGEVVNDTGMFWGVPYYNQMLLQAGPQGNVQSEILFAKDSQFTWKNGWAFPSRVYFNGDDCVIPDPQDYPSLPGGSTALRIGWVSPLCVLFSIVLSLVNLGAINLL